MSELHSHSLLAELGGDLDVVIELGGEVALEDLQVVLVALLHGGDGETGGSLEADELPEHRLALHDAEWSLSGSAEGWQPADQLDWVDVGGDDDQLGQLVLHQSGHLVETELQEVWLGSHVLLALLLLLGELDESGLLLLLVLRGVLRQKRVQLLGYE